MDTIVFRGLINNDGQSIINSSFKDRLETVRTWHDGQIVLATWDNQKLDFNHKLVDDIILLKDPGEGKVSHNVHFAIQKTQKNLKRQLTLAIEGVKLATGERILLTRTDMRHNTNKFENCINNKIIVPSMLSIIPGVFVNNSHKYFHPSDLFQYGYSKDIKNWASDGVKELVLKNQDCYLTIEEMWCIAYVNLYKNYSIDFYNSSEYKDLSWKVLLENFVFYDMISDLDTFFEKEPYCGFNEVQPCSLSSELYKKELNKIR